MLAPRAAPLTAASLKDLLSYVKKITAAGINTYIRAAGIIRSDNFCPCTETSSSLWKFCLRKSQIMSRHNMNRATAANNLIVDIIYFGLAFKPIATVKTR